MDSKETPHREVGKEREHAFLTAIYETRERHIAAYGRPERITMSGIDAYYLEMYFFSEYLGPEAKDGFPAELEVLYDMNVYQALSMSRGCFVVAGPGGAMRGTAPKPILGEIKKEPK